VSSDDHDDGADALLPPVRRRPVEGAPLRDVVDLVPERQVAAAALNRAKEAARAKGLRPGDAPRRRPLIDTTGTAGTGPRDPQAVGQSLGALVGQFGWGSGLVSGTLQHRWVELLGAEVAEHCAYVSLEAGVLTVQASSTSWATHLGWAAPTMLQRFATELGEGVVSEVKVLGPSGPGFGRGRKKVQGRGVRDTYG
jgi:predicted nucleic acid-binding Zn ribbon protein